MVWYPRLSLILLVSCIVQFANRAPGQTLSIAKKGPTEFLIKAATPPNTRYVLQESENLHLWIDSNNEVSGQITNQYVAGPRQRFFRLAPWAPSAPPIRIVLLGDSTVGTGIGWGTAISGYFKPTVTVVNLGAANYSSKIFLASEQKPQMLAIKPDFVLMQFGWVDAGGCGGEPDRCGTTLEEYATNLRIIIQLIRGFNGIPILITPPDPKVFDDNGKLLRNVALQERIRVLKEVAAESRLDVIDLNALGAGLLNTLGKSGSDYLSLSETDHVHFSPEGAVVFSGLVVKALPANLGPYLVGNLNQPKKPSGP